MILRVSLGPPGSLSPLGCASSCGSQPWGLPPWRWSCALHNIETDDGWAMGPSEACVLREVTKRPRGTPSSRASMSVALDVRQYTPLASDACQMPLGVATLIDSSFRVKRGRHYWKNLRRYWRQKELRQTVHALGIHPGAKPHSPLPRDNQPHHSSGHPDEVMLDLLEEGQLPWGQSLSYSMLKEWGRFGMEGLGWRLGAELGGWEGLSG